MVNMGLPAYLISATLIAALSQRLVRKVCKSCGKPVTLGEGARAALKRFLRADVDFAVMQAGTCPDCGYTGYRGRMAVYELFEPTDAIREMIIQGAAEREIEEAARKAGMKDLIDNAWIKLKSNLTTVEEVLSLGFQKAEDAIALGPQAVPERPPETESPEVPPAEGETVIDFDANPPK
jgi:type II secretory ATPase GspE/PulE/Tfp pilus assembly ATPase PilB-like protein